MSCESGGSNEQLRRARRRYELVRHRSPASFYAAGRAWHGQCCGHGTGSAAAMARAVLRERGAPLQRISAHLGDLVGSPGGGSRVVQQREKRDRGCDLAHDGLRSKEGSEGSGGGEGALAWRMTAWISPMTSFSLLFAPPSAPAPASVCTSNTHRSSVSPTSRDAYLSRDSPPPPHLLRLSLASRPRPASRPLPSREGGEGS